MCKRDGVCVRVANVYKTYFMCNLCNVVYVCMIILNNLFYL